MNVFKKTVHGTKIAVITQEAMDAIVAHETHEAELAQRKAAPAASNKATGTRVHPQQQEAFHAKEE